MTEYAEISPRNLHAVNSRQGALDGTGVRHGPLSLAVLSIVVHALLVGPVQADALEEVVVTAQKRAQNMQDVGISVTAFTSEQLKEFGVTNTVDLVAHTPGLNVVTPFGSGNNVAFTLRGVGLNDFSESNEAPVAVYLDGVYNATLAGTGFQLFDIERAEVLRGPQGTLYGRNTTGGLVHFITRKPGREFDASVELSLAEYGQTRVEAALGGPLDERLSARASIMYHKDDGYMKATQPGVDDGSQTDNISGRLQILYEPSENLSALFNIHASNADQVGAAYKHTASMFGADGFDSVAVPADLDVYGTCPGCDLTGYRDNNHSFYRTDNDREPFVDLETWGGSVTLEWQSGDIRIVSISAYEDINKESGEDTDVGPNPFVEVTNPVDSRQWSQEFQFSGSGENQRWTAGLYYFKRLMDSGTRTDLSRETYIGFPINNNTITDDKTTSWSVFGQYEWDLSDALTLIAGLRYTDENRKFEMIVNDDSGVYESFGVPNPVFAFTKATAGDLTKHDDQSLSFRGEIDWHMSDDVMWFASFSKGSKGAGFNIDIGIDPRTVEDIPFKEEKLYAYELGFKSDLFGGTTRLNATAFYYDYKDYQAFSFEGLSNVVSNKDGTIYGLDAELITRPWTGWEFNLGLNLLDTEVEDINTGVSVIDRDFTMSPKLTFNALARYEWAMAGGSMALQGDLQHVGKQHFDITNTTLGTEDSYTLVNLRATYTTGSGKSSLALWVKNVGDEEYRAYAIQVPGLGFSQSMVGTPRWFGVTLRHNWM